MSNLLDPKHKSTNPNNDDEAQPLPPPPPPLIPPLSFPTGRTVPFPYAAPYPQQVALMDALLRCLRMREEADRQFLECVHCCGPFGWKNPSVMNQGEP